ncbi:MAG: hypothetical protein V4760_10415 [Bdellovibrionota bacterium]
MKLKTIVLACAVVATGAACSKGSDGNGGRNTPRGISPSMASEYAKPQVYNQKAVDFLASQAKKSNASLPSTGLLMKNDKNDEAYKKLDAKGKAWFERVNDNCSIKNPPKLEQAEGQHSRTESISGGADCPMRYKQTETVQLSMTKTDRLVTFSGQTSTGSSTEIVDPQMQADTGSKKMLIEMSMNIQGDAAHDGNRMTDMAMKMDGSGRFEALMSDGNISGEFKFEVAISGSDSASSLLVVGVATLHTPEGDLALGIKMQDKTMEFRVGGRVMTAEEFGKVFGPLPVDPTAAFLANVQ